jgi:hypothetical protein
MRAPKDRFEFVHEFLNRVFADDLHAKRVLSLANGALGVMTSAALAVSLVGQALAQARGILPKSGIKQVDRLLSVDFHEGLSRIRRQFPWASDLYRLSGISAKLIVARTATGSDPYGNAGSVRWETGKE